MILSALRPLLCNSLRPQHTLHMKCINSTNGTVRSHRIHIKEAIYGLTDLGMSGMEDQLGVLRFCRQPLATTFFLFPWVYLYMDGSVYIKYKPLYAIPLHMVSIACLVTLQHYIV